MITQTFLNEVLELPELRRSFALEKFLMTVAYDEFNESKKSVEQLIGKRDIRTSITKRNIEDQQLQDFPIEGFRTRSGHVDPPHPRSTFASRRT